MTVKELIQQLELCNPDMTVVIEDSDNTFRDLSTVQLLSWIKAAANQYLVWLR